MGRPRKDGMTSRQGDSVRQPGPTLAAVRAALYCRVSTEEQAEEGQSIAAQLRLLEEHCTRNHLDLAERFVDEGFSATTDKRPAFQRMIARAKASPRPFDVILVHKTDRFARNREHAIVYKNLLRRECGVDVVSITEAFGDSPQGRLMEGILEVMAEFYSANLGQEVRKGMTEKARRGAALGMAPVGYRIGSDGHLQPAPGAAEAVRWVFETYAKGAMGYQSIARALRSDGQARFPGLPAFKWSAQAVRQVLRNEVYVGRRIWNKRNGAAHGRLRPHEDWIIADQAHSPLVPEELFAQVQSRMATRLGPKGSLGDYLLRGLVRCAECGAVMYRRRMTKRGGGSSGGEMILSCGRYYRGDDACYFNWLPEADALAALADHLRRIADGAKLEAYSFSFAPPDQEALVAAQRALEQCAARFQRQAAAYEAGVLDLVELRAAKERLTAERDAIERRITAERAKTPCAQLPATAIRQRVAQALRILGGPAGDVGAQRAGVQATVAGMTYSRRERRLRITLRV